jgi:hypothetical protein
MERKRAGMTGINQFDNIFLAGKVNNNATHATTSPYPLQELRAASDDAWEDLKTGAENVWTEVKTAFQNAATRFK